MKKIQNSKFKIQNSLPSTLYPSLGFTIIELLVSIAIISIVIGITFAGYTGFSHRQSLISAGQNMKNIIRDAQSRAYTGEIDCSVCDCEPLVSSTLVGWYVDFGNKKIYGKCTGGDFGDKPYNLSNEIVVELTPAVPESLFFRQRPPSADHEAMICLSSTYLSGSYYTINVKTSGEISDSRGIVSSCP